MISKCNLKVKVKQGEALSIGFTIREDGKPFALDNYTVCFKVKQAPLEEATPFIDKEITTTSDENTIGRITEPSRGVFQVRLNKEDTSFPPGEYYLVISIVDGDYNNIISSCSCSKAYFYICEQ